MASFTKPRARRKEKMAPAYISMFTKLRMEEPICSHRTQCAAWAKTGTRPLHACGMPARTPTVLVAKAIPTVDCFIDPEIFVKHYIPNIF